jgi:2-polyprenyl-6-methoxyphenol hydroxylase-like FAD-dependent oxidoreductase
VSEAHDGASGLDATARRDRQVLVVGTDLSAAACGGFLAQAGLDPIVAPAPEPDWRPAAPVVPIWRPGLVVLERLGLRRPVEDVGTRLDGLDRLGEGRRSRVDATGRPALVAIYRDDLADLLQRHVFGRIRTVETPATAVDHASSHVTVTFAESIRERFDLAITTSGAVLDDAADRDGQDHGHRWGFEWPDDVPSPALPTEGWEAAHAAFTTPAGDRTAVELLAAGDVAQTAVLDREALRDRFGAVLPGPATLFDTLEPAALSYRRTGLHPRASRVADRTALVGPAVRPSGAGNPLTAALAVEDAWVLADALAYGPESVSAALDTYQRRRRRRDDRIDAHDPCVPRGPSPHRRPSLDRLAHARALAFGHVVGDDLPGLARVGPDQL